MEKRQSLSSLSSEPKGKKRKAFGFTAKDSSSDEDEAHSGRTGASFDFHKESNELGLVSLQKDRMLTDPSLAKAKKKKKKLSATE